MAVLTAVVAMAATAVGYANPWHLVVVDRWLYHPWLAGVLVLAAAWVFWHLNIRAEAWRSAAFALLTAASLVWPMVGAGLYLLDNFSRTDWMKTATSQHNDVTATLTSGMGSMSHTVTLEADRGLGSRRHVIGDIGYLRGGDSGPPPLDLELTAADKLTVRYEGQVVYRVTFDPRTLDVVREECTLVEDPPYVEIGCEG